MKLYLVRHGEALAKDVDPDQSLSEVGRANVERLAGFVGLRGVRAARILHSGKARARQTAEILAEAMADAEALESAIPDDREDPTVQPDGSSGRAEDVAAPETGDGPDPTVSTGEVVTGERSVDASESAAEEDGTSMDEPDEEIVDSDPSGGRPAVVWEEFAKTDEEVEEEPPEPARSNESRYARRSAKLPRISDDPNADVESLTGFRARLRGTDD